MKGSIKPRGRSTWRIRISLPYRAGEKRKYLTETYHGLKSGAEERMNTMLSDFHQGSITQASKLSLHEYLKKWLAQSLEGSVSHRTYEDYDALITRYILPKLGHLSLAKLSPIDVQGLYNEMRGRGLSPRTVRYTHNVLSRALRQAAIWGFVQRNVAQFTELPKQESREMKAMSAEQLIAFLDAARFDKYYAMWYLVAATGLRPEEYLALRWTDIQGSNLIVQRAVCYRRKGGGYYYTQPKSKKGLRTIHLTRLTLDLLDDHKEQQAKDRDEAGDAWIEEGLIFPNASGRPVSISNLHRRHFKPLLKAAGIGDFRLYDLRHTHASVLLNKNTPLKDVSERLGHASIKLTGDVYWHTAADAQKRASDIFDEDIFSRTKSGDLQTKTESGDQSVTKSQKAG